MPATEPRNPVLEAPGDVAVDLDADGVVALALEGFEDAVAGAEGDLFFAGNAAHEDADAFV